MKNAIKERRKFQPDKKRGDRVFLLLDAEGPGNVPGGGRAPELPAAERLAAQSSIEIVYSSPAFEYWLLCHFPKPPRGQFADCDAVIAELNKRWASVSKTAYRKADPEVFVRLRDRLADAIDQALQIDLHHRKSGFPRTGFNPSSQVYELVAVLIGAKSGQRCPLDGTWKLQVDANVSLSIQKGDVMPRHNRTDVSWHL